MGAQVQYGTFAVGAYYAQMLGSHQPAFTDQYRPSWDRGGARSPTTWRDRSKFVDLWPRGRFGSSATDGSEAYAPLGLDYSGTGGYMPFSCDGAGTQTLRFIRGYSRDSDGNVLGSCIVQAFTTDTDTPQPPVQSAVDGFFAAPTETLPGRAHYLVAYKDGSPDVAGTTVDTLTSTDIAGG